MYDLPPRRRISLILVKLGPAHRRGSLGSLGGGVVYYDYCYNRNTMNASSVVLLVREKRAPVPQPTAELLTVTDGRSQLRLGDATVTPTVANT